MLQLELHPAQQSSSLPAPSATAQTSWSSQPTRKYPILFFGAWCLVAVQHMLACVLLQLVLKQAILSASLTAVPPPPPTTHTLPPAATSPAPAAAVRASSTPSVSTLTPSVSTSTSQSHHQSPTPTPTPPLSFCQGGSLDCCPPPPTPPLPNTPYSLSFPCPAATSPAPAAAVRAPSTLPVSTLTSPSRQAWPSRCTSRRTGKALSSSGSPWSASCTRGDGGRTLQELASLALRRSLNRQVLAKGPRQPRWGGGGYACMLVTCRTAEGLGAGTIRWKRGVHLHDGDSS